MCKVELEKKPNTKILYSEYDDNSNTNDNNTNDDKSFSINSATTNNNNADTKYNYVSSFCLNKTCFVLRL